MKILSITAGAAGMYCGSCTRDNALARELLARGHDVTLVPVYTPTRPDEPNVSRNRVLFGGISVYLQQHVAALSPHCRACSIGCGIRLASSAPLPAARSRRMRALLGDLTISMLQGERGVLRKEFDKLVDWIRDEPLPEIINLPNSLLIALAAPLKRAFRRPVCCTLQGEELFLDGLVPPFREEARALIRDQTRAIDRFVAVSDYCAAFMSSYLTIPATQIAVVPLGISMEGYEEPDTPEPGCVYRRVLRSHRPGEGTASARRRVRAPAPANTPRRPCGWKSPAIFARANQSYVDEVRRTLDGCGIRQRVLVSRRARPRRESSRSCARLDVLSVPATYDEPKGMFLLEAMASGVPVVQPRRGAFVEIVERTGGGLLVAPDNPDALAEGLHAMWSSAREQVRIGSSGVPRRENSLHRVAVGRHGCSTCTRLSSVAPRRQVCRLHSQRVIRAPGLPRQQALFDATRPSGCAF